MGFLRKKDKSAYSYFSAPYTTHPQLPQGHRFNFALNLISLRTLPTTNWKPKIATKVW